MIVNLWMSTPAKNESTPKNAKK